MTAGSAGKPFADHSLRIAVVGAGPAGLYTADSLTLSGPQAAQVDVIERLPVPFGLLRYGVAPDHFKIKGVSAALEGVLARPNVRLFANVALGSDITVEELRARYDAVIYALGACTDRMLHIPGEALPGSYSATAFVNWYNGHPERTPIDLGSASSAAIIGVGNVAVDVARLLLMPPAQLQPTDVPQDVIAAFLASTITDVHMIGRRGPESAKFTTKELRELGELDNLDILVDPSELPADVPPDASPNVKRNLATLTEWAHRPLQGRPRRLHFHFRLRPVAIHGSATVSGLRLEHSDPVADTSAAFDLSVQLIVRSVGYRATSLPGLPFDETTHTIPTIEHRVVRAGAAQRGEYAVGWIKRGPTGILGTNRKDADETIQALRADEAHLIAQRVSTPQRLDDLLTARAVRHVDAARWAAIVRAELAHGGSHGRGSVKIAEWPELLRAAGLGEAAGIPW